MGQEALCWPSARRWWRPLGRTPCSVSAAPQPTTCSLGGSTTAIILSAAVTLLWRAFARPAGRLPWLALGIGVLLHLVGDVMYSAAPDLNAVPVPSIYDPLWLAIYPCAYVALLLLIRQRVGKTLLALRLDGVVSGLAAASLLASVSLPLAIDATAGAPFWETATSLAYTVGDLILLGAVVSAIALSGWRLDRMWLLLGGAVLAWEAADLIYLFGVTGQVALMADALVATGAIGMAAAGYADSGESEQRAPVAHGMLVPVGSGAVALGVLALGAPLDLNPAALALAAVALALALVRMGFALRENDKLLGESRVEAATDALTGLPNRRSLKADLSAALEAGAPHVLVLIDLNGFKSYNDAFGHAAGDAVLTRLGAALTRTVRGRGAAYRMGGDEFCVLAGCPPEQAEAFSARCAAAMGLRGQGFSITAAHGAVTIPGEHGSAAAALALADERMYQRKRGGRVPAARQSANVLARGGRGARSRAGRAHALGTRAGPRHRGRGRRGRRRARGAALRGRAARHRQAGDPDRRAREARPARRPTSGSWSASTRSSASASSPRRPRSSAAPGWCAGATSASTAPAIRTA